MANDISKRGRDNSGPSVGRGRNRGAIAGNRTPTAATGARPGRNARRLISVFGSSRAREGDELYTEALWMGRLLGKSGFDVVTGGYAGVMEAVSRGAHEAGAHVKGITMRAFGETVNPYVLDEITVRDFYARLRRLVESCGRLRGDARRDGDIGRADVHLAEAMAQNVARAAMRTGGPPLATGAG